jgi:hypothetical protein
VPGEGRWGGGGGRGQRLVGSYLTMAAWQGRKNGRLTGGALLQCKRGAESKGIQTDSIRFKIFQTNSSYI